MSDIPHAFDPIWQFVFEAHSRTVRCEAHWETFSAAALRHRELYARLLEDTRNNAEIIQLQTVLIDAAEAFLFQTGLLSLLLFGGASGPDGRAHRLRALLGVGADAALTALESRGPRNAFAHIDERMDTAVARHGNTFALNYFEADRNAAVPLERCLRSINSGSMCVAVNGTSYDLAAIRESIAHVRDGLERARTLLAEAERRLSI
jgi:hypothetical protein